MTKKYDYIIWDWNGTLFNDLQASINATNYLLEEAALPLLTLERYHKLFRFPVKEYYADLGFDFSKKSYEVLAEEYTKHLIIENQKVSLHNGAYPVLSKLYSLGYKQLIVSAAQKDILIDRLEYLGIKKFFSEVLALQDCFAEGKIVLAVQWRVKHPDAKVLMIGDTTHDLDTAKAINADCILFSDGHGNKDKLKATGYPVINSFEEVLNFL